MTKPKILLFGIVFLLAGCLPSQQPEKNYGEIPSMLNVLTNTAQSAVEQGYFEKGEPAVLEYIEKKAPNIYHWFQKRSYDLKVGVVDGYSVVVVCDEGSTVFEDTFCDGGPPDRDYRGKNTKTPCGVTMTPNEVQIICE